MITEVLSFFLLSRLYSGFALADLFSLVQTKIATVEQLIVEGSLG